MRTNFSNAPLPLLYVDNDEHDRHLLKVAIQRTNTVFQLYTADGAESAAPYFDIHQQSPAANPCPRPKLILLDYDMGTHTGADFLFWLRVMRHLTAIPVIMFSGSVGARHVAECYEAGADHFLRKPVGLKAIQGILRVLHFCMSFNPPRFGALARLSEFEADPRTRLAAALAA